MGFSYGINAVFWLWPLMTVGTMTASPASESGGGSLANSSGSTQRKASGVTPEKPQGQSQTMTKIVDRASRDMILHATTTLSRSWSDLSRMFGRMRDAIAYERLMHATFGWALSPMQRLMPSAAWPLAYANIHRFDAPTHGARPLTGADMFSLGISWWRSVSQPVSWQQLSGWQPPHGKANNGSPNDLAACVFAPVLGFAAGMQQLMPGMGFGLVG